MRRLVVALVLLAAAPANAGERDWYGWEIMLTDAMSIGLVATGRTVPAVIGLAGYALAGPTLHVVHGDGAEALADLGLRVGLPVGASLLVISDAPPCHDCDGVGVWPLFFIAGAATAMAFDYGLLSTHERVSVAPTRGGAVVTLAGRF